MTRSDADAVLLCLGFRPCDLDLPPLTAAEIRAYVAASGASWRSRPRLVWSREPEAGRGRTPAPI